MEEFDFSIIMTGKINLRVIKGAPDDMEFEELFKNGYIKIVSAEVTIKDELDEDIVPYDELNPEAGIIIEQQLGLLISKIGEAGLN